MFAHMSGMYMTNICVVDGNMECFTYEYMVRSYHVYNHVWEAEKGEVLQCRRERSNLHDPYSIAKVKNDTVVGHVLQKLSTLFSMFLQSGSIKCRVTGNRRYSNDLP